jgi:tRNA dimethylallyltransferase
MFAAGLEAEARALADKYGWNVEAMKGIGYREFYDYFSGAQNLTQTRERIITSTVHLAKKQRTWFNRNKSIHWFSTPVNYQQIVELITTFLNK